MALRKSTFAELDKLVDLEQRFSNINSRYAADVEDLLNQIEAFPRSRSQKALYDMVQGSLENFMDRNGLDND